MKNLICKIKIFIIRLFYSKETKRLLKLYNCNLKKEVEVLEKIKPMNKTILLVLFIFLTASCPPGKYRVTKVQDGDTISVKGYSKPIRVLGIDAPESKMNYKVAKQAKRYGVSEEEVLKMGKIAKAQARRTLLGRCVVLESDYRDRGRYGRPLRYVHLDKLDYQAFMLKNEMVFSYCGDKKILMYEYYNSLSKFRCR